MTPRRPQSELRRRAVQQALASLRFATRKSNTAEAIASARRSLSSSYPPAQAYWLGWLEGHAEARGCSIERLLEAEAAE